MQVTTVDEARDADQAPNRRLKKNLLVLALFVNYYVMSKGDFGVVTYLLTSMNYALAIKLYAPREESGQIEDDGESQFKAKKASSLILVQAIKQIAILSIVMPDTYSTNLNRLVDIVNFIGFLI